MKTYKEMMDELHPDPKLIEQTKECMVQKTPCIQHKLRYAALMITAVLVIFMIYSTDDDKKEQHLSQIDKTQQQLASDSANFTPQYVKQLTKHKEHNESVLYDEDFTLHNFELISIQQLLQKQENTIYSPFSTNFTMGMLYSGLDGNSKQQIGELLQADQIEVETYLKACYMKYRSEHLLIDNSLWFNDQHAVNQATLQEIAQLYAADSFHIDFSKQQEIDELNKYIENKSGQMLHPDNQTDPNLTFKLMNITTLQTKWVNDFHSIGPFHNFYLADGTATQSSFISTSITSPSYEKNDQYEAVELAFTDGSMLRIVLPDASIQINELLDDTETMKHLLYDPLAQTNKVLNINIPTFSITSEWYLNSFLKANGVIDLFKQNTTDLHLFGDQLYLDRVEQIASIDLNESGVHVASETHADGKTLGLTIPDTTIDMNVNRPFLYMITASDQQLIYVGTVYDPAK